MNTLSLAQNLIRKWGQYKNNAENAKEKQIRIKNEPGLKGKICFVCHSVGNCILLSNKIHIFILDKYFRTSSSN